MPIKIGSNAEFTNYDFIGNGSLNAPYMIENLKISSTSIELIDINTASNRLVLGIPAVPGERICTDGHIFVDRANQLSGAIDNS